MNVDPSPEVPSISDEELEGLRLGHKKLLHGLGLMILSIGLLVLLIALLGPPLGPEAALLSGLIWLAGVIVVIIGVYQTASRVGIHPVVAVLICILVLQPCALLSIIVIGLVSERATRKLKANGYKVGFLGAPPKDMSQTV